MRSFLPGIFGSMAAKPSNAQDKASQDAGSNAQVEAPTWPTEQPAHKPEAEHAIKAQSNDQANVIAGSSGFNLPGVQPSSDSAAQSQQPASSGDQAQGANAMPGLFAGLFTAPTPSPNETNPTILSTE